MHCIDNMNILLIWLFVLFYGHAYLQRACVIFLCHTFGLMHSPSSNVVSM